MLCTDNMANLNYIFTMCYAKEIKIFFGLKKKIFDQKQKAHIMLNEQCKARHDNA